MTEEIILVRDDSKIPWGFRLTGGRDFNSPLTIVRITGQSIAEKRGLRVGDIITEINNQKTTNLCHNEAQRFIADGGNFLKLIILRGSSPAIPPASTPVRGMTPVLPCNFEKRKTTSTISAESVYSLYEDDSFELLDQSGDEYSEFHEPTEEEINLMLLENAEVIEEKGKNVIGVNFKRFIPKCEFIKDSAVFQVLQEEQVHKELTEKEQLQKCPNKRFSTFLAPPDRPILAPKPKPNSIEDTQGEKSEGAEEKNDNDDENDNETLTPVEENFENEKPDQEEEDNEIENLNDEYGEKEYTITDNNDKPGQSTKKQEPEITEKKNLDGPKNEFENKLNSIKNTLSSLEQLPSIIQSQLAAIQAQIEQLTQIKPINAEENVSEERKQSQDEVSAQDNEFNIDSFSENDQIDESTELEENFEKNDVESQQKHDNEETEDNNEQRTAENENLENDNDTNDETTQNNEPPSVEQVTPKRRPACPLTPLPRPVVLPGGRIWRKPRDAYNEEFIAETLISQAEVLVGSTLGVNFRKYEPPKFDLSNSAVYKLVHNIESKKTGLQDRDTIPSLQDYYQSPISARHFYCANLANRKNDNEENQ